MTSHNSNSYVLSDTVTTVCLSIDRVLLLLYDTTSFDAVP